jgi:hypothetical protein
MPVAEIVLYFENGQGRIQQKGVSPPADLFSMTSVPLW